VKFQYALEYLLKKKNTSAFMSVIIKFKVVFAEALKGAGMMPSYLFSLLLPRFAGPVLIRRFAKMVSVLFSREIAQIMSK